MPTDQELCRAVFDRIAPWLRTTFGELLKENRDELWFSMLIGSAITQVLLLPYGALDTVLVIRSYVVTGARLEASLLRFLLETNARVRFGAFGIDGDGDIFFQHSLLGSTCDLQEIQASTMTVASVADEFDDAIVERWGGKRALDLVR